MSTNHLDIERVRTELQTLYQALQARARSGIAQDFAANALATKLEHYAKIEETRRLAKVYINRLKKNPAFPKDSGA